MDHPWKEIALSDYENHMRLDSVMQLQAMNEMMGGQFSHYEISTAMVLGIAGGNGLCHVGESRLSKVFGVDINGEYLTECQARYPHLSGVFEPIEADLTDPFLKLPKTDLLIANLLIEYIGYGPFQNAVKLAAPRYVSCIIQVNTDEGFVSHSPYAEAFVRLDEVHHQISEEGLDDAVGALGYGFLLREEKPLPNGKKLVRLDYGRRE